MHRFLPLLLLLFTACASDPLELHVADVDWSGDDDVLTPVASPEGALTPGSTELLPAHEDLNLKFSYRIKEGTSATLLLQNKYAIGLPDLSVKGGEPRIVPSATPGIWQDAEIVFIAPEEGSPAILPAVYLNGTLVYYQQEFSADDAPQGPLTLTVENGELEIKDVRKSDEGGVSSKIDANGVNLNIPLLRYEYFELSDSPDRLTDWKETPVLKTGYINRFDLPAIRERGNGYAIRFTGKLQIPKAGEYMISTFTPSYLSVFIDGKEIINDFGPKKGARRAEGMIELTEGVHDFRFEYVQPGGWGFVNVKYKAPGEKGEKFLNTMGGEKVIATPGTPNPQKLETDEYPYLLRSFLFFPAPKVYEAATKRTHVISVGEADGPHYSIDLQNGALLQMWRGDFADTHDMWVSRGEPQVMRPLGPAISLDGTPQWAAISRDGDSWPDAIADDADFRHARHTLDAAGRPTFEYTMKGGHSMTDKLTPTDKGLLRELTHSAGGSTTIYTQIAAGREITEVAPGEYTMLGPGLKLKIESYDGTRLVLQHAEGKDRLLAELPAKGHLTYLIEW
ncbi:hypothetical protein FUA23_00935 [Neolewinella aurantiaca]|uniref:PA14 domain-containing protein n=1 Tax=Neolewinella aurantiaca TaxID=2602767 RepID=A0A5C7FY65_9BACT|nr:PA14 domain-containing protein [Neolewinella aurantiaca]TXF91781.1 hypothetical protein FUA23_00935 [Neolewinella aurantiaca]